MLCRRRKKGTVQSHDAGRCKLSIDRCRLHATKYPWEHEKFTKTFDHQTYALAPTSRAKECTDPN